MSNISNIIPIHKKGPTSDPDKYRPIALSSCLGKCRRREEPSALKPSTRRDSAKER